METNNTVKRRVFSGVQPSGDLHIGNYLGAIRRWAAEQHEKDSFFCVVDLHAITVYQDPGVLRRMTRDVAALYIACGIDPYQSTIFIQSHVPAHAECAWILNCVTPVGWLERMTQYKAKSALQESVSTGLLDYPVLQAADILLYDADEVPVGEDQKQHVELTRDVAQRFNRLYGEIFVVPEPRLPESGARIRALNDPAKKMSKSEAGVRGHAVRLIDPPDTVQEIVKRAVTDTGREILFSDQPAKAGVNNLLEIYQLFTAQSREEIEAHFLGKGYAGLKAEVAEVIIEGLRPIQEKYRQLISNPDELDSILDAGANRACAIADLKVDQVKDAVGFVRRRDKSNTASWKFDDV